MVRGSIWPCLMDCCKHILAGPAARPQRPGLILAMAVTGLMIGPWYGLTEECVAGESQPRFEHESTDAMMILHSGTAPAEQDTAEAPRTGEPQPYWVVALQRPIATDGRGALIARLGTMIREGNSTGARQFLSAAVETGTLAFMMLLHFDDPALHARLQEMAANGLNEPVYALPSVVAVDVTTMAKSANAGVEPPVQEESSAPLNAAHEQLTALEMSKTRVAELEATLEQEKGRTASARHDVERANRQLAEMSESVANVAALKDEVAREKDRAEAALLELTDVRQQLSVLKGSAAEAVELREKLAQEKDRSDSVAQERDALEQQLTNMKLDRVKIVEIENAAAHEKQRADAALQQLDAIQDKLATLNASELKKQDDIEREKERGALMAEQLESAQSEIATLKVNLNNLGDVNEALRQEKEEAVAALRGQQMVRGQLATLRSGTAKPDALQKSLHPSRLHAAQRKEMSRFQRSKSYSRIRRGGVWTGLMGGYGNARGLRTTNGPGIW
jgi:hypothetical protein